MSPVRTPLRLPATIAAAAVLTLVPLAAHAAPATGEGAGGQTLTVSATTGLDPAGSTVTVTGAGFEESVGIYVGVCVDNGPGKRPTPCLGGVDMGGEGGTSAWVSSNPPSYGKGLATPFGDGGTFRLTLTVPGADANVDCADAAAAPRGCVVASFADHTRLTDRSADVRVPVTFGVPEPSTTEAPATEAPATEAPAPVRPTEAATDAPTTPAPSPTTTPAPTSSPTSSPAADDTRASEASARFWLLVTAGLLVAAVAVVASVRRVRAARVRELDAAPGAAPARDDAAQDDAARDDAAPDDALQGDGTPPDDAPGTPAPRDDLGSADGPRA